MADQTAGNQIPREDHAGEQGGEDGAVPQGQSGGGAGHGFSRLEDAKEKEKKDGQGKHKLFHRDALSFVFLQCMKDEGRL